MRLKPAGQRYAPEDLLARLVSFDSTSRNSNLPIIDFIEAYLASWGVASQRIDHVPGVKTNLLASIGPAIAGGVVLSGHTDVVPVDGQTWSTPPFELTARDGKLYGRGACDMKGFLAVVLAHVPEFLAAGLKRPVHFAWSCDEEIGCNGVRPLVAEMARALPKPAAVIVGEPTLMRVVNAHKGVLTYATEVTGHEAHSSLTDRGVNAITVAAEMIGEAERIALEFRARDDASGRFDPPYSTLHVGTITGGTVRNIVPRYCRFDWETRLIPGADPEEAPVRLGNFARGLQSKMKAVAPDAGIATRRTNAIPALAPEPDPPAEALAFQLAGANTATAVSYCTEAGHFQAAGMSTVICGPGSIEQAHRPDEYIARSELALCSQFMLRLIAHLR